MGGRLVGGNPTTTVMKGVEAVVDMGDDIILIPADIVGDPCQRPVPGKNIVSHSYEPQQVLQGDNFPGLLEH